MEQSADAVRTLFVFAHRQEQFGHLIDHEEDRLLAAFNLSKDAFHCPAQSAVVRVFCRSHFEIDTCGAYRQPAKCLACLAKNERYAAERLGMKAAFRQAIDELLGERQLIVATLDIHEHRTSPRLTLQFTQT